MSEQLVERAEAAAALARQSAEQTAGDRTAIEEMLAKIETEKLPEIEESKEAIRQAIEERGQTCAKDVPFSEYCQKIREIKSGTDTSGDTVTAGAMLDGVTAHNAAGEQITGTIKTVTQAAPTVSVNSSTGLVTAKYTPKSGMVEDTSEKSGTLQLTKATQPAPTATIDKSTGKVTAKYTPSAGYVTDTSQKSGTLQLTAQAAQTITPGTSDQTIPADRYLTGAQTIKGDSDLVAGNIKSGVSIFGVTGSLEVAEPVIPSTCIAYLGSNGKLYIKQNSGVTVGGLTKQSTTDREGWDAYSGFSSGAFAGSVLSKDGVYLQWSGFSDFTQKWTLHSLISGYPTNATNWPDSTARVAWGFDTQDWGYEGNYNLSDLPCYLYGRDNGSGSGGTKFDNTAAWLWDGHGNNNNVFAAGMYPAAFTWDGPGGKAYTLNGITFGNQAVRTTIYPYDEEMGMPGDKYTVGIRLYLGKPSSFGTNWNGYGHVTSGMCIGGFALEVGSSGYTDGASYISPFLDGKYKNL